MFQRYVSLITAGCLLLTAGCGPWTMPGNLASFGRAATGFNPETFFAAKRVAAVYAGPLTVSVDPALAKRAGFKTSSLARPFRLVSTSTGTGEDHDRGLGNSGGADADNPGHGNDGGNNGNHFGQQRRHDAWMIEHGSYTHHARDDQGQYFNPDDPTGMVNLQIDPKVGEQPIGEASVGAASFSTGTPNAANPDPKPMEVASGNLAIYPKSDAAMQQILQLVGGRVTGKSGEDFVTIAMDLSKANLTRLPDYVRLFSQFSEAPITSAEFSSVDLARTMALTLMLVTEHQDLFYSLSLDATVPLTMPTGQAPPDTKERLTPQPFDWAHLGSHRIREGWRFGMGRGNGRKIRVAYVDRGFQIDHRDLIRCINTRDAKLFNKDHTSLVQWGLNALDAFDNSGHFVPGGAFHGTYCLLAGFADINNGAGGLGMAPDAEVIPLATARSNVDKANAISYAIDLGVDVIGSSLAFPIALPIWWRLTGGDVRREIKRAYDNNIPVVNAAGNETGDALWTLEGDMYEPIIVGAAEPPTSALPWRGATYSNWGRRVDIWASATIGVDDHQDILSNPAGLMNQMFPFTGTSAAAPQVTAVVALMKGLADKAGYRGLTVEQIRTILRSSSLRGMVDRAARQFDVGGYDIVEGPILNANDAISRVLSLVPDQAKRAETLYTIRDFRGIMTRVVPSGAFDMADIILNGTLYPSGLGAVGASAYGRETSANTYTSFTGDDFTLVKGEYWPTPGAPASAPPFDVYRVESTPVPPEVSSFSPTIVMAGTASTINVSGQYLLPAVRLQLTDTGNPSNVQTVTGSGGNGTFSQVSFPLNGSIPAATYRATVMTPFNQTTKDILNNDLFLTVNSPAPTPAPNIWRARVFNIDDTAHVSVNINSNVITVGNGGSADVDITQYMNTFNFDNNVITLDLFNSGGIYTWGFQLYCNGNQIYCTQGGNKAAGIGARNNDTSTGRVFGQDIYVSGNGTVNIITGSTERTCGP